MKKYLIYILLLVVGGLLCGCAAKQEELLIEDYSSYEDTTNQLISDATSVNTESGEENLTEEPEVEVNDEPAPEKTVLAKTYKQVYPELYTFYTDDPEYTYSKWIFKLDNQSGFVGSIFMKDGTVITSERGSGKDDTNINYDREDGTSGIGGGSTGNIPNGGSNSGITGGQQGDSIGGSVGSNGGNNGGTSGGGTGSGGNNNQQTPGGSTAGGNDGTTDNSGTNNNTAGSNTGNGNSNGKEVGDKTKNPLGKDVMFTSPTGDYSIDVTTKVIPQAIVDEVNSTPYILAFSTQGKKYRLTTDTIEGANKALLEDGLYDVMVGKVTIDSNRVLKTNRGVFSTYIFTDANTGKVHDYAVTYIPKYSANTVYMLYGDTLEDNVNIYSMMQQMISEE